jgi:nitrate reductase gamma subunit
MFYLKNLTVAGISALTFMFISTTAWATWLIDAERFHVSVHGQLSCHDCHDDISEKSPHPVPANVNKRLNDFFDPETCFACHDDVFDEIDEGIHAGKEATHWQRFENCIECHNPHDQLSSTGNLTAKDLNATTEQKCSLCHTYQPELPAFSDKDQACLQCHQAFKGDNPKNADKAAKICLHCHRADRSSQDMSFESHPLIDLTQYANTPHKDVSCMACHPQSMAFGHGDQIVGDCGQCHFPHDEKVAHDAHINVACEACHLNPIVPTRNPDNGRVEWRKITGADRISNIHQMQKPEKEASCRNCHKKDNTIGAAAMVLPAKSVICMLCHAATLSVGDTITSLSLFLFLFGFVAVGSVWFSAGNQIQGAWNKLLQTIRAILCTVFSSRIFLIVKVLILDGLFQRRLFIISKERWLLHAFVFYPFIFRFVWGMLALGASLWFPGWSGITVLLNKNNPVTACLFDLSGFMVILGVIGMIGRRLLDSTRRAKIKLPASDWLAYALLGGIMIVGFVLEGMRMAMTGSPGGAAYAFIGDAISRLLYTSNLTGIYGYVWYLHAGLTGAFVAYLPFSQLFHMIMAPVSVTIKASYRSD